MWAAQVEALARDHRVIAPDLRGIGDSPMADGVFDVDTLADDVNETLDSLGVAGQAVVGGLSMGGYVAFSFLARHGARVRGLVLLNTRAGGDSPAAAEGREKLAAELEAKDSVEPVVQAMIPKLFAPKTFAELPELVEAVRERALRLNPRALASTLRGLAIRPDRTGMLGSIRVPTLIIGGADDQVIPRDEICAMANGISGAEVRIIPDAGHLTPIEASETVNKHLSMFLSRMDA